MALPRTAGHHHGGYAVNLAVYAALVGSGAHSAAAVSFVVAAANNYWWNRHWTFAAHEGPLRLPGSPLLRRLVRRAAASTSSGCSSSSTGSGWGKIVAQAIAIVLVTPLNFIGNKLWSFRR